MSKELAPEVAAVAAFLSDISGFLDDEGGHQAFTSILTERIQLPHSVSDGTLANNIANGTVHHENEEAKSSLPVDEAERKRVLCNFKTGKRRDAYRKRLKEEWQTLRSEEVKLAAKLEELQGRRRTDHGGVAHSAWRAIAMRQLEGRIIAEAQQEKLRTAVKRRRELLQDVEDSLQKRLKEADDVRGAISSARHEHSDEHLFEAYLGELDGIYAKTDAVFQSSEATPTTGPFLTTKPPVKRDGDTEYLENLGVMYAPFDFERTCLAVWEVTRQSYRQLDRLEYTTGTASNTIAVKFRVKQTGGMVSMFTHFVSRRYVEADRMVIVWRELWEGEGEFEGMHSDETGWCIVQPGDDVETDRASPTDEAATIATVIKTCVRLVPMHFSSNVSCEPDFDRFTEVLVKSGKEDNLQIEQMMERMQLGDAEESVQD
ncbi:hypothetical protein V7S43_004104 [Phytophthora oleae]|uniref:Uncharacterized protein n=1 Tax=Phytophthora oleae TaxID=2107226 RepID=A0ABD3FXH4_9STRA